ncbi:ABC transporter permease [Oceanobacillus sp. J11TS1]|uniref:ABC transporter permease n=1 Tax=Oceanobacillus sp. J11TS1 TaxID=2807191 RepID=UPI001B0B74F8|nr:ABC transporter permease [Oceanobacillus sp. J11TS1]GIO24642.1 ABC transporter permease [Oceanobacillus sp. J11TS1]
MKMAWKEIKRNKLRYTILGSIVFLISLLTFIISGLANGLSQDNASLIKNLPNGTFYMTEDADETYNFSTIPETQQKEILDEQPDATFFSIQMGNFIDEADKQRSVAYVTATDDTYFPDVKEGEVILDTSMEEEGIAIGDEITNEQWNQTLTVAGFVEHEKYSHSPAAFISQADFQELFHTDSMQIGFITEGAINDTAAFTDLQPFSNSDFLNTIPSYNAEQMSLNMIVIFLLVISGMLFAIFFYMINVQKLGIYGILKAIGVKTGRLFQMMWAQMLFISIISLVFSILISQLFQWLAPSGMPFHLTLQTTLLLSIIFVVIGFIGATLSGIQIKRVEPMQAIQQGEM